MRHALLSGTAAALLVLGLGACGGSDGSSGPTFSDSVSTADAEGMANSAAGFAGGAIGQLNFGSPILAPPAAVTAEFQRLSLVSGVTLRAPQPRFLAGVRAPAGLQAAVQAASGEGCSIEAHGGIFYGDIVDVDQNGIPDDAYLKIECVTTDSTSNPDTTITQKLYEEVSIRQRFGDLYGYDLFYNVRQEVTDGFGNFERGSQEYTERLSLRAGAAEHALSATLAQSAKFDTLSQNIGAGQSWQAAFDPTGTIVLGDPLPSGSLTLTGREYVVDSEDTNLSFSLSTPTALAYDAGCYAADNDPPFTAGAIRGLLNNHASSASFLATFTACGAAPTITTEGTHDPMVTASAR